MSDPRPTRARILEAALKRVADSGFAGLTIGRLAADTQMSKSGLFGHFGSQSAVQIAVIKAAAERFAEDVTAPARAERDPGKRLEPLARRWISWLTTPGKGLPCPLIQAAFSAPGLTEDAADEAVAIRAQFAPYIARQARAAISAGDFRADLDADDFAFSFEGVGLAASAVAVRDRQEAFKRARAAYIQLFADARRT